MGRIWVLKGSENERGRAVTWMRLDLLQLEVSWSGLVMYDWHRWLDTYRTKDDDLAIPPLLYEMTPRPQFRTTHSTEQVLG